MNEYVVVVAFGVEADTMKDAQEALMEKLVPLLQSRDANSQITEWWIAEDERYDGSDLDSAVFVPMGTQPEAVAVLDGAR